MDEKITIFICTNIGIILNLTGTVFIAISFGRYPNKKGAPYTVDQKIGKLYIAYNNHPILFKFGLLLLFVGFFLQLKF